MKKQHLTFTILWLVCLACNNSGKSPKAPGIDPENKAPGLTITDERNCYTGISGTDSVFLTLSRNGDSISGELSYAIFGKDKNKGRFAGRMAGDTLVASYSFVSEGITSIREVAFLKKDGTLTEGFGKVEQVDGGMRFSVPRLLDFSKGIILRESLCN